jgi:uncharacterized membrane protein (DUF2068 family)
MGSGERTLRFIALFKLLQGVLLLGISLGAMLLVRRDVADLVAAWVTELDLDPENRAVTWLFQHVGTAQPHTLKAVSIGMFCYAAVLLTEGTGLLWRRRWAEYVTVLVTASLIPVEVYEVVKHTTAIRLVVLSLNGMVVWYLFRRVRRTAAGQG